MDSTMTALKGVSVTGAIRLASSRTGPALYMASTGPQTPNAAPYYEFATTLAPVPFEGSASSMPTIVVPQPLSPPPAFDICFLADGTLDVAYQVFGGAWNELQVNSAGGGALKPLYGYAANDCGRPRFVRDTSSTGATTVAVTTTLDYQNVALLIPGTTETDGTVNVITTNLVSAAACVAFADLSGSTTANLSLVYKTDRKAAPLSPGNLFLGKLALAGFDLGRKTLGTPVPLVPDVELAEFDVAYQDGLYCLIATTGDGLPLLAVFDAAGKPVGDAYLPFGAWNNPRGWVTSPTIVADPAAFTNGALKFDFAFVEMDGDTPTGVLVSSIGATPKGGVTPAPQNGAAPAA